MHPSLGALEEGKCSYSTGSYHMNLGWVDPCGCGPAGRGLHLSRFVMKGCGEARSLIGCVCVSIGAWPCHEARTWPRVSPR